MLQGCRILLLDGLLVQPKLHSKSDLFSLTRECWAAAYLRGQSQVQLSAGKYVGRQRKGS